MHLAMAASHLELQVQRTSQGTVFSEENLYNTAQPGKTSQQWNELTGGNKKGSSG